MNKTTCLLVSAFLLSGGAAFAQGELDAYKYSQTDLHGTARYLGMGGAFGALGGDISAMSANPAGLGIYRSSEVVTTLSLSSIKTKSDWNGIKSDGSKTKFNFDNIAYVGYFPTGNDNGIVSWNVGFSYNRVKNFNRNYRLKGKQDFSLADYAASQASHFQGYNETTNRFDGIPEDDFRPLLSSTDAERRLAYDNLGGAWLPALAYQGGLIGGDKPGGDKYHSAFAELNEQGGWHPNSRPDDVLLDVSESGGIDKYDFSFATNISNRVFLGATISVTDLNYRMTSQYTENYYFDNGDVDFLHWDNEKSTDGTGYSFNIGAIVRPADFLRLGVAYNSPTWYKMTDRYNGYAKTLVGGLGEMEGETPINPNPFTDYKLRTADKWIFSAAGFIGQTAMISVDYELSNYKYMNLADIEGSEYSDNEAIKSDFGLSQAIKVGAEVKLTPQFAVRAGLNLRTSPMKKEFKEGNLEIFPAGTVAHYTLDKGTTAYTVGLGYRFTPNFYADLACVFRQYKEDAYTFSKVIVDDKVLVDSDAIGLKTNTTQVALTLGYKF